MNTETTTDYGRLYVGSKEELFATAVALLTDHIGGPGGHGIDIALSGGSTPQEWYRWCVSKRALSADLVKSARFTVSDERCVPLHSEQSNFGQAERLLLDPLRVAASQRQPWPVHLLPHEAADAYVVSRTDGAGGIRAYDVCFLGMGEDGHTASIFPGSPLLNDGSGRLFSAVDVPGKGWRLTVTPAGLFRCGRIVVMALGAAKAPMLRRVLEGKFEPSATPVQLLKTVKDKVIILTDQEI